MRALKSKPPGVTPAQPNWTWTTSEGTTYHNVVVTKIGPDTVSITHTMGVAHDIPIATLPPDIQKLLNYDPAAASAARREAAREEAHPFYTYNDRAEAQDLARQMHWPVAWIDGFGADLTSPNPAPDTEADLTQRAVNRLKTRAIVVFVEGNDHLGDMSSVIRDQLFTLDDGVIPGGHHFLGPKTVLTDPDVTVAVGRISSTQLLHEGDGSIDRALDAVFAGAPPVVAYPNAAPPAAVSSASETTTPVATPVPAATNASSAVAEQPWTPPAVTPALPNWTWTTLDGVTYQDVVITKIEPATVSITHANGVAHIPINLLPPDLQKQLNYQPHVR